MTKKTIIWISLFGTIFLASAATYANLSELQTTPNLVQNLDKNENCQLDNDKLTNLRSEFKDNFPSNWFHNRFWWDMKSKLNEIKNAYNNWDIDEAISLWESIKDELDIPDRMKERIQNKLDKMSDEDYEFFEERNNRNHSHRWNWFQAQLPNSIR